MNVAIDRPTRILVIDDNDRVRDALCARLTLTSNTYSVSSAANAEEALHLLALEQYDVVLCDLVLTSGLSDRRFSGTALVREIHVRYPSVRIVVFTGKDGDQTKADVLQAGAFLFLSKPVNFDALAHTIDTINSIRRTEYLAHCFETLADIAYKLQSSLQYRDIARRVVSGCLDLGFDRARLYRYDPEIHTLIGEAAAGMPASFRMRDYSIPFQASPIIGHIFAHDRPYLWNKDEITNVFGPASTESWMTDLELHDIAWIDCPLMVGNERIGTLSVDHRVHPHRSYSVEDLKIMGVFAGLAAHALNNAALYKQEALTNASLRRVLLDAPDVVISTDLDGAINVVSPSVERVTGFRPSHFTGRPAADIFTDEHGESDIGTQIVGDIMHTLLQARTVTDRRVFLRNLQGDAKALALTAHLLRGDDGRAIGMLASLKDLEASEAQSGQYRELLEGIGYGMLLLSKSGKIAFCNRKASVLLGREPSLLRGCRLVDSVPAAERGALERALQAALGRGEEAVLELILSTAEGVPAQARLHFTPVRAGTKLTGVVVALYGQEEYFTLLQWGRLADLGRMVASVAHEINNPLNNLIPTARDLEALLRRAGAVPARIAAYLDTIERNGQRIQRIVEQLRDFARPRQFQREPTSLNAVILESIEFFSARFRENDVHVEMQLAENLPVIFADATHLWQVFVNILGNAAEAMEGQSEPKVIRIFTRFVEPKTVVAEIMDSGPGIANEVRGSLFDPFVTTKGGGRGTGLGLATSKSIIEEKHGGRIRASNNSDRGAIFAIELPVDESRSDQLSREV